MASQIGRGAEPFGVSHRYLITVIEWIRELGLIKLAKQKIRQVFETEADFKNF